MDAPGGAGELVEAKTDGGRSPWRRRGSAFATAHSRHHTVSARFTFSRAVPNGDGGGSTTSVVTAREAFGAETGAALDAGFTTGFGGLLTSGEAFLGTTTGVAPTTGAVAAVANAAAV